MTTEPTPSAELMLRSEPTETDSWIPVVADVANLASKIADTDFVPRGLRGSVAATAAAILYGREVGLPPMTALAMTHVVEGKPGLSAEAMRALVYAAGHELEFLETTGAVCRMRGRRRGQEGWTELAWTLDMARAAGLLGKNNWQNYPRALLQARCTTELCRMLYPDVIHGFRSVEELEDMGAEDGDTAPVPALAGPTTKVSRKRATPKKQTGTPPTPAEPRSESAPPVSGPPLPGEPGFDTPPAGAVSGESPSPDGEADSGTLEDTAPDTGEPFTDAELSAPVSRDPEPPGDVVDAEVVDEPTGPDPVPVEDAVAETIGKLHTPEANVEEEAAKHPGSPRPCTRAQQRMMFGQYKALGVEDDPERHEITGVIIGRPINSFNVLTHDEAHAVIDTLGRAKDYNALALILDAVERERNETPLPLDMP